MESNLIQATEESEQLNESIQENNIQDEFNEIISPSSSKENATSLPEKDDKEFDKNSVNEEVPNNPSLKDRSSSQQSLLS